MILLSYTTSRLEGRIVLYKEELKALKLDQFDASWKNIQTNT